MSERSLANRLRAIGFLLVAVYAVMTARLWYLQVVRGEHYMQLADVNRIRVVPIRAPRGAIYDRYGQPLVRNRFSYTVSLVPLGLDEESKPYVFDTLARILNMPQEEISRILVEESGPYPYEPVRLKRDATAEMVIAIEERREDLPGVLVEEEWTREYVYGEVLSHTLGYLGAVDKDDLQKGYRPTDLIGKNGLELAYEAFLRGEDGQRRVEVNARGRPIRELSTIDPIPGYDMYLTIDLSVQLAAEEAMRTHLAQVNKTSRYKKAGAGAVVAMDPRSGEILALVSQPGYDPNQFISENRSAYYMQITAHPQSPLLNRALRDFPPGSTFKPFTGLTALEADTLQPNEYYNATGYGKYGKKDWTLNAVPQQAPAGRVTIVGALARSANDFFWEIALRPKTGGVDAIARMARSFGFGQPTGLRISPAEKAGLVPDKAWKERIYGVGWYEAETMDVAIGQGFLKVTPLQMAVAYSGIANRGDMYRPILVRRIMTPERQVVMEAASQLARRVQVAQEHWEVIIEGLRAVIQWPNGTAQSSFRNTQYDAAGKTGSAQTSPGQPAHGWFAAMAPATDPEIVVVVFAEFGEGGASAAAPIARQVLDAYFAAKEARAAQNTAEIPIPAPGNLPHVDFSQALRSPAD
ncbi:MAG TPA: penicillin-binding protein 2 [Firmicutes bacterium]|nr:penicillin-binding protein 2 [Bacillota bacterium]